LNISGVIGNARAYFLQHARRGENATGHRGRLAQRIAGQHFAFLGVSVGTGTHGQPRMGRRHTRLAFSTNVGRSGCYRAVLRQCGLILTYCGSERPDILS